MRNECGDKLSFTEQSLKKVQQQQRLKKKLSSFKDEHIEHFCKKTGAKIQNDYIADYLKKTILSIDL